MSIRVGQKISLMNEGEHGVKIMPGVLCCAFGKGKFTAKATLDSVDTEKDILFTLEDSHSQILFNNVLTTVGEVLKLKRESMPLADINYHDILDDDGVKFKLAQKHHVVFQPQASQQVTEVEGGGVATLQANAAALVPAGLWQTVYTKLVWSMVWKSKGLMPIRPQIIFTFSGEVLPGEALVIA